MIVISGRARLLESKVDDVVGAAAVMAAASRGEAGCDDYRFAIDVEDHLVLQIFERWESVESLDAHFAAAHFVAFSEVLLGAVDGSGEFLRYEVSSASSPLDEASGRHEPDDQVPCTVAGQGSR